MKTPRFAALIVVLLASVACSSCKTTSPPDGGPVGPTVGTVLVDCAKMIGGPVVGSEIPKIVTALTSDDVESGMTNIIAEITDSGFLVTEAFDFAACVARNEFGRAQRDATFGDAPALKRANAAEHWLDAHGVVFVGPGGAPLAKKAVK